MRIWLLLAEVFMQKDCIIFWKLRLLEFPFFFGNQYTKNPEADALIAYNGGKSFEDEFFAAPYLQGILHDEPTLIKMGQNAKKFIDEQPQAAELIAERIFLSAQVST